MAQKLFVGGLPFATSNDQLRSLFAECGEVASATVVTDRDTGRSRGFGFVEMATPEAAEEAINRYNGRDYEGRRLQVEKAKSPSAGGGGGRPARTAGGRGGRW
jgi:cold-inducible RNA-binding protein